MIIPFDFVLPRSGDKLRFQMDLSPDDAGHAAMLHYLRASQIPEPEVVHLMLRTVRPGDVVIDGGANIGFFTILLTRLVGYNGRVIAVEPGTNNLPALRRNIELNDCSNVQVRAVALRPVRGEMEFRLQDDGGLNSAWGEGGRRVHVMCERLDTLELDLLEVHGTAWTRLPKLIKLDIEGSELEALAGATDMLQDQRVPYIVCEMNEQALARARTPSRDVIAFMRDHGYALFVLREDGTLPAFVPPESVLVAARQNTNVLFSTPAAVGRAWPEVVA